MKDGTGAVLTRDDGQTLAIDGRLMGLVTLEGMDAPAMEVFTEKRAVGDGDIITGQRVAARQITLKARARSAAHNRELRTAASAFLHPARSYDLRVRYGGCERTARDCRLRALAMPTGNLYQPFEMTLTLLCASGWLDAGGLWGENLNRVDGRLGWPMVFLPMVAEYRYVRGGMMFSQRAYGDAAEVNNTGDGPTWVRAEMTALGPDAVPNPCLWTDGGQVRAAVTLRPGDVLALDGEKGTVRLNGQSALHLLTADSSMDALRLLPGPHMTGYTAGEHGEQLRVRIWCAARCYGMGAEAKGE